MKPSPTADQQNHRRSQRRPRFWVAPLLVGVCFSLGFGITKRVTTLQANAEQPKQLLFAPTRFPGRDLASLRDLYGGVPGDLQVDVAALPVVELAVAEVPDPLTPEPVAAVAPQPELQAAITTPEPEWTRPAWSDDPFDAAAPVPLNEPVIEDSAEQPPQTPVLGTPAEDSLVLEGPTPPEGFFSRVEGPPVVIPDF